MLSIHIGTLVAVALSLSGCRLSQLYSAAPAALPHAVGYASADELPIERQEARTHLSLNKDAPIPRAVQAAGRILCRPILGGLHHQYGRI